jgi:hypothetical protein
MKVNRTRWTESSALKALGKSVSKINEHFVVVQGGDLSLRQCSAMDYLGRTRTVLVQTDAKA